MAESVSISRRRTRVEIVFASCALLCASAMADLQVNLELLDRDVYADIPENLVVIDISVALEADDTWLLSGLFGRVTSGIGTEFRYAVDPNTGETVFTRPDRDGAPLTVDEKYVTFVSLPRSQTGGARFRRGGEPCAGPGIFAPFPVASADVFDVVHSECEFSGTQGSGYTNRIALAVSGAAFDAGDVYISRTGPASENDVLVAGMIAAAASIGPAGETVIHFDWGVYAVPEPTTAILILMAATVMRRYRP